MKKHQKVKKYRIPSGPLPAENRQAIHSSGHNYLFGEILSLMGDVHFKLSFYVENCDYGRPGSFLQVMF